MWELRNRTPFQAVQAFDRDEEGREVLCIALRGSFTPDQGNLCRLCEDQETPLLAPVYEGDALLYDTDIVPFMPGSEITVHGHADPVIETPRVASISLGSLKKAVSLHPEHSLLADRSIKTSIDTGRIPLDWTRCPGGITAQGELHPANPIGCGFDSYDPPFERPLPRITAVGETPASATTVIGLGPIQRHWEPRLSAAGSYDDAWSESRAPLPPFDFDRRYHHAAPADQCLSEPLKGGERLLVEGFTIGADFEVRLPQVIIEVQAEFSAAQEAAKARLYRVRVHPEHAKFDLLWIATVPCGGRDHLLRRTTIRLQQSAGISR